MKLLFVNACLRGEKSRTLKLCKDFLEKFEARMKEKGETWEIEELDLGIEKLDVQDGEVLRLRDEKIGTKDFKDPMFRHAKQLIEADYVVIGAPYWDLQFPAVLKIWLERCSVTGLTFIYSPEGIPAGQCHAKGFTYITTTGAPIGNYNFGFEYVKGLFEGLFGIENGHFIAGEALDIIGNDVDAILEEVKDKITAAVNTL